MNRKKSAIRKKIRESKPLITRVCKCGCGRKFTVRKGHGRDKKVFFSNDCYLAYKAVTDKEFHRDVRRVTREEKMASQVLFINMKGAKNVNQNGKAA